MEGAITVHAPWEVSLAVKAADASCAGSGGLGPEPLCAEGWNDDHGEASTEGGCSNVCSDEEQSSLSTGTSSVLPSLCGAPSPCSSPLDSPSGSPCGSPSGAAAGGAFDASAVDEAVEDTRLAAREDGLRRAVPKILEVMNQASVDVNFLERQVGAAQGRYTRSVAAYTALYEELRDKDRTAFDRVKPYFSATLEVKAASHRMSNMTFDFAAAGAELAKAELLSSPSEVQRLRMRLEQCEQDYVRALGEHRSTQQSLEALRVRLGGQTLERFLPDFQQLQEQQLQMTVEQSRMNTLAERARRAKHTYKQSMCDLEEISIAVHSLRKEHREQSR